MEMQMGTVQLSNMIKKRKSELGLTIQKISTESGVAERTVNRILAGEDVRYSSLLAVLEVVGLSISVNAA
jgi:transcriptional regulator with XRE-family HTH domain